MPRVGRHPLKVTGLSDQLRFEKITVATIVYIPSLDAYWAEGLEVLKMFFESLYTNTNQPFDLMVFDNGSCEAVQNYLLDLHAQNKIHYLVLSNVNLRKSGALFWLLSAAPGDYVAFADSDVYFLPGWLDHSLAVLDAFPQAGRVTALPMTGGDYTKNESAAFQAAQNDPSVSIETGFLVPENYVLTQQASVGISKEQYQHQPDRKDVLLTSGKIQAFLSGADFQFTITREALDAILPLHIRHLSVSRSKDPKTRQRSDPIYSPVVEDRLRSKGYWMLSTTEYLVHHMGNRIPDLKAELAWCDFDTPKKEGPTKVSKPSSRSLVKTRLLQSARIRRLLHAIHTYSYKLLYE